MNFESSDDIFIFQHPGVKYIDDPYKPHGYAKTESCSYNSPPKLDDKQPVPKDRRDRSEYLGHHRDSRVIHLNQKLLLDIAEAQKELSREKGQKVIVSIFHYDRVLSEFAKDQITTGPEHKYGHKQAASLKPGPLEQHAIQPWVVGPSRLAQQRLQPTIQPVVHARTGHVDNHIAHANARQFSRVV